MERSTVLALLSLFTLLAGMAFASWELWDAERKKRADNPTKIGGPTKR